jgi:hypothetical protein
MNTPSKQPKTIFVSLNTGGDPAVRVDSDIWAKPKMVWVPDPDSEEFTFVDMDFVKGQSPAFKSIEVRPEEITLECSNVVMNVPNQPWVYRIKVKAGESEYSTDETLSPDGDRPVIRN